MEVPTLTSPASRDPPADAIFAYPGCPLNNPAEEMNPPLTTVSAAARRAFPTRGAPPKTHIATLEPPTPSVNAGPIAARAGRCRSRQAPGAGPPRHTLWLALSVA